MSDSTRVTFDASHKTVVGVCSCGAWRRVALVADRAKLVTAAAAHVELEHDAAGAYELARRAERLK